VIDSHVEYVTTVAAQLLQTCLFLALVYLIYKIIVGMITTTSWLQVGDQFRSYPRYSWKLLRDVAVPKHESTT